MSNDTSNDNLVSFPSPEIVTPGHVSLKADKTPPPVINVPYGFTEKKSRSQREKEQMMQDFISRAEVYRDIVDPFQKTMNMVLLNISALITILTEKDVFTEPEFLEALQRVQDELRKSRTSIPPDIPVEVEVIAPDEEN